LIERGDLRGVVNRAVIHHKDLNMRVRLRQDAFYRITQEVRLIVARNYNRDERQLIHY